MADETRWVWDPETRRYRDRETGRFLGARRVHTLRDRYVTHRAGQMDTFIAETVGAVDRSDRAAWRAAVRRTETLGWRRIENTLITEYVYGRGGIAAMTEADTTRLRHLLREQKRYWRAYMREAVDDPEKMTTEYMQRRARYYHRSSTGFHERGKASAWGASLPTYPGQQQCGPNCKCHWQMEESDEELRAYWRLGPADHCDDCTENSKRYNPYRITRTTETGVFT